ncbi:MAG: hypothetical protein GOVbin630_49 [Prokaryotic dsDNA virus sp.]|nr:MAG: hypothetical protein GOVbin630_49 [Prokaryotic dsDNA virus sp.]|tara:strand:+ start:1626 stop:2753 length:1128 start_codon:yes stop_codon:yes gene_type:complete
MSSMLEQAIIDAEQLKETAQQTAEEAVVEKYQDEIKEAIEKILEQDETVDEAETAVTVDGDGNLDLVEDLPAAQMGDMDEVVEIDLNKLEEMMAEEMEEGIMDASDLSSREEIAEDLDALSEDDSLSEEIELDEESLLELLDDDVEITEDTIAALVAEVLSEDAISDSTKEEEAEEKESGVGVDDTKLEEDKEEEEAQKGKKRDKDDGSGAGGGYKRGYKDKPMKDLPFQESLQKKNKTLLKEQKRSERKVQLLENKVNKYGTVIKQLKDKLNESNLTNAKLLYQNRILNSVSLNERQKDKIVEAISNANSVEEAKLIFETLQSAVGVSKKKNSRKLESLNEVVSRSSSAFIPRKEVKTSSDAFSERMKRLAGLK